MNVGSICKRQVVTVTSQAGLAEAAQLMRERHVGYLVVLDPVHGPARAPIGVLTDRDIVVSVVAKDADPRALKVADVMSMQPSVVAEGDAVQTALKTMLRMGVRRLPVVDSGGALAGILSLDDLLDFLAEEFEDLAGAVRNERQIEGVLRS